LTACLNILLVSLWLHIGRWDLTSDQRYTISPATKTLMEQVDAPMTVQVLMDGGAMNAGFERLDQATNDLIDELHAINSNCVQISGEVPTNLGLQPVLVHERSNNGQMVQTPVYPYAIVRYKNRLRVVQLLQNNPSRSGEENLNSSIEALEYRMADAINGVLHPRTEKVAFLEGHGELNERDVYDWEKELSRYYQIDRGVLGKEVGVLDDYKVVIIADPREALSETDKYIIDQYIMQGGRVMWLLDGVRFSNDMLQENGLTPVIAEDWGVREMLFKYGVRINPVLVQDLQCQMVPVEVSGSTTNAQFQPMPWTYAPLLLTSDESPITKNIAQVKSVMVSEVEAVGEDKIDKQILLATSTASRKTGVPAEVNLMDWTVAPELFDMAYIPVAMSLEGSFSSLFAHRMAPDGIEGEKARGREGEKVSVKTRQIVVACGRIGVNEWQGQGQAEQPLPVGYDRYMKTQFGNRDFLVNSVLWLADEQGLMQLRGRHVQLRLLNDKRSYRLRSRIQMISILSLVLVLMIVGGMVLGIRRKKYIA